MKLKQFYHGLYENIFVIPTLIFTCFLFAILTFFDARLFDLLSFWSKPEYPWQWVSGIFIHGSKEAPVWFLFVHLFMNLLMLIPFGILTERMLGSKRTLILFLTTWVVNSIVFHLAVPNTNEPASGISVICYSFGMIGFGFFIRYIRSERRAIFRQPLFYFYLFLFFSMMSMLNPYRTGLVSCKLHLSGVATGLFFLLLYRNACSAAYSKLSAASAGDNTRIHQSAFYLLITLIPISMMVITILFWCGCF